MTQAALLTSFKRHAEEVATGWPIAAAYSIAVYQPKWLPKLPETRVFDIRDDAGNWIRPRDFIPEGHDPTLPDDELLKRYSTALMDLYVERAVAAQLFLRNAGDSFALCCWCPYDRAAKRQLHDYGSFVCHSAVVERFLTLAGVNVIRDEDRARMVRL